MNRFKLNVVNIMVFLIVIISLVSGGGILRSSYNTKKEIIILQQKQINLHDRGGGLRRDGCLYLSRGETMYNPKSIMVNNGVQIWNNINQNMNRVILLSKISMITILLMSIVIVFLVVLCESKKV